MWIDSKFSDSTTYERTRRSRFRRNATDLEEIVNQAFGFVSLQAERNSVALIQKIAGVARHAVADKRAVLQILINLLSNGVKYTQRGGHVIVEADLKGDRLEVAVSDTGIGIGEADLARLGQPFEQVESEYTRAKEGTGLGLALVRALIHLHGGTMTITSAVGAGTTVRFVLPAPEAGNQTAETGNRKSEVRMG